MLLQGLNIILTLDTCLSSFDKLYASIFRFTTIHKDKGKENTINLFSVNIIKFILFSIIGIQLM